MIKIPYFLYSDVNCDQCCEMVHGVIMATPTQKPLVEAIAGYVRMDCHEVNSLHHEQWEIWKKYSDSIYEVFLQKHPLPDINDIIMKRCKEHGLEYFPNKNGVEI